MRREVRARYEVLGNRIELRAQGSGERDEARAERCKVLRVIIYEGKL
jgi:hypothetical protein